METLTSLFIDTATRFPDALALRSDRQNLTYRQLLGRSRALARQLKHRPGFHEQEPLMVCFSSSVDSVIALTALLQLGIPWVPFNMDMGSARIKALDEQCGERWILIDEDNLKLAEGLPEERIVNISELLNEENEDCEELILSEIDDNSTLCILFTSGSSGQPKGVCLSHTGILSRIRQLYRRQPFSPDETTFFVNTRYTTVDSLWELFGPLLAGKTIWWCNHDVRNDYPRLLQQLNTQGVQRLCLVPSLLQMFMDTRIPLAASAPGIRLWVTSGEVLDKEVCQRFYHEHPEAKLINQYGLTESSADITEFDTSVEFLHGEPLPVFQRRTAVPIGHPFDHVTLYLRQGEQVVPYPPQPGQIREGELLIGGPCLCQGYYEQIESAEKWLQFAEQRLLVTGDYVQVDDEDNLYYCYRLDELLNINGYNVYPLEVAQCAELHPAITRAAVTGDENGRLAIYFQTKPGLELTSHELWQFCRQRLARHMVPLSYISVAELPKTASGKINIKALPPAGIEHRIRHTSSQALTETARQLLIIWKTLLNLSDISVEDDFFACGGDSILMVKLVNLVNQQFNSCLPVSAFYQRPLLQDQVVLIEKASVSQESLIRPQAESDKLAGCQLSTLQQGMLFSESFRGDARIHLLSHRFIFASNEIDSSRLAEVINEVVNQIPSLCHKFMIDERGEMRYDDPVTFEVEEYTASSAIALSAVMKDLAATPINPLECLPFRVIIGSAPEVLEIVFSAHHTVIDGQSFILLFQKIAQAYEHGVQTVAEHLTCQTSALVGWLEREQQFLNSSEADNQRAYWQHYLAGVCGQQTLPGRKTTSNSAAARYQLELTEHQSERIEQWTSQQGITPYLFFFAVFAWSAAWLRDEEVVLGSVRNQRETPELAQTIGPLINNFALRVGISDDSVNGSLSTLKHAMAASMAHSDLPWAQVIQSALGRDSDAQISLFYIFDNAAEKQFTLTGKPGSWVPSTPAALEYDVVLRVDKVQGYQLTLDYLTEAFTAEWIADFSHRLQALATSLCQQHDTLSGHLQHAFEGLSFQATAEMSQEAYVMQDMLDLIMHRITTCTDSPALHDSTQSWSYSQLGDEIADMEAGLRACRVQAGDVIAINLTRGNEMVALMLAVLRIGATFLPLDPLFPAERRQMMLSDAQAALLICTEQDNDNVDSTTLSLRQLVHRGKVAQVDSEPVPAQPNSTAYLMYTSGSTGKPKAVRVSRSSLTNLLIDMSKRTGITERDVLLAVTTISFDISLLELFMPLMAGAEIGIADTQTAADPLLLSQKLSTGRYSMMQTTPTRWQMLLDAGWTKPASLKALTGGEALPPSVLKALTANGDKILNLYGPTETTIWSTAIWLGSNDSVTLGQPIANTLIWLLDSEGNPVQKGQIGEIGISGAGVSQGYHQRPELTLAQFRPNRLTTDALHRTLYMTGDMGRINDAGNLEYHGRRDSQIKIRGHRLEVAEVEAYLTSVPQIAQAVVTASEQQQLISHIVLDKPDDSTTSPVDLSLFFFSAMGADEQDELYNQVMACSRYADEHGFHAIWTPERHFSDVGAAYPNPAVLSAAIAATTQRVKIRAGSVVMPLHDPLRVAEEWAVVDHLSSGRAGLALASGWNPDDFVFYPEKYTGRRQQLANDLTLLRQLWQGEKVARTNGEGKVREVAIYPQPRSGELPVWITAAGGREAFELAGREGTNILTHMLSQDSERLAANIEAYRSALRKSGYDPQHFSVTVMLHTYVQQDDQDAREQCREAFKRYLQAFLSFESLRDIAEADQQDIANHFDDILEVACDRYIEQASLIGGVKECVARVQALTRIGVTEIGCLVDFGVSHQQMMSSLDYLSQVHQALQGEVSFDEAAVREHVAQRLPRYMCPDIYQIHDDFPQTLNGKIDRKKLVTSFQKRPSNAQADTMLSSTEQTLQMLWSEVLGRTNVSVTEDFFLLGGHSILAARLINRINQTLSLALTVRDLFTNSHIRSLATCIDSLLAPHSGLQLIPQPTGKPAPLSFAQQRLWFLSHLSENDFLYNTPLAYQLTGSLDPERLEQSFQAVITRHDALRTIFTNQGTAQLSTKLDPATFRLKQRDLSNIDVSEQQMLISRLRSEEESLNFDLTADFRLRATLIFLGPNQWILLLTAHHIATDGWSLGLIMEDLYHYYQASLSGQDAKLKQLELNYLDFSHWQVQCVNAGLYDDSLTWWQKKLVNLPTTFTLTADKPRPAKQSSRGALCQRLVPYEEVERLRNFAGQRGATLFMAMHAAFSLLLARWTQQSDVVIGTPVSGRTEQQLESVVGLFINTLVLRQQVEADKNFEQLLENSKHTLLEAMEHQELPFELLVEKLNPPRSLAHSPLFQILLVLQNQHEQVFSLPGVTLTTLLPNTLTAKFDLTLNLVERDEGLEINWEYCADLFLEDTVERMADSFLVLLSQLMLHPEQPAKKLSMLPQSDLLAIELWNKTDCPFPTDNCLPDLFTAACQRTPTAPALRFDSGMMTYSEMSEQANQMANFLLDQGVRAADTVGVCLSRSPRLLISILAIWRIGACYVPLDANYPAERLSWMVDNAEIGLILCDKATRIQLPAIGERLLCLDEAEDIISHSPTTPVSNWLDNGSAAFVIYTSGTTGKPKGVIQTHRTMVNVALAQASRGAINTALPTLFFASLNFDVSLQEIATAWLTGSELVVISDAVKTNLSTLPEVLNQFDVGRLFVPPAILNWLSCEVVERQLHFPALREVLTGGEALQISGPLKQFLQSHQALRLWDQYGPAETHLTSMHEVDRNSGALYQTIGPLQQNVRGLVLDESGNIQPLGIVGELYIGGDGVAIGYINNPTLTDERFRTLDLPGFDSQRFYRTGDLVRWLPDGELAFIGRADNQFKLRGYRIEAAEIESQLLAHSFLNEAVVLPQKVGGEDTLVAYLTSSDDGLQVDEVTMILRKDLHQKLPAFMVPDHYIFLDKMPVTLNGKVDRKALPLPGRKYSALSEYVAPANETETQLQIICGELLEIEDPSCDHDFFTLGGHSLLALRLISNINKRLGISLSVADLYLNPTIQGMAQYISKPPERIVATIDLNQGEPMAQTLFCIPGMGATSLSFQSLASELAPNWRLVSFMSNGLENDLQPATDLSTIITEYVRQITIQQPEGIIWLAGHSFGGKLAFELASVLVHQGRQLHLVLLDTLLHTPESVQARYKTADDRLDKSAAWQALSLLDDHLGADVTQLEEFASLLVERDLPLTDPALLIRILRLFLAQQDLAKQMNVDTPLLNCDLTFISASQTLINAAERQDVESNYKQCISGRVTMRAIAADHYSMLEVPQVAHLATIINSLRA
ncbi:hypothetical protein BTO01_29130 [Vibrio jasicida]|uniref:non-ribosomal peptide synthetase n=1 Tax=Vibrio jasicida TaxID=766224 RepID=UPI000CF38029|nr:non-ribosomal peptide synthetase [Vibrio jasicida]PQJ44590.1 hypothetical protein BTO01_29130 [Vibrio jasicida]